MEALEIGLYSPRLSQLPPKTNIFVSHFTTVAKVSFM